MLPSVEKSLPPTSKHIKKGKIEKNKCERQQERKWEKGTEKIGQVNEKHLGRQNSFNQKRKEEQRKRKNQAKEELFNTMVYK